MKKRIIILVFVLILASILRLYKIGEVPYDQAADYIDTIGHYTEVKWLYDNIFVKHNFNFHNLVHYNLAGVKTDFYFSLPFYIILHNNLSLHVTSFIFEILTIVFLYLFTKEFLDEKTALIASFLYAILPSAIEWHRYVLEHSKFSFFAVFSLFLFYRWNKTKQKKYLFFTASTMGFALSVHMSFIFFICSFLTFITIEKLLSKNMKFNSRDVNYFLTGFTIGALLLIINTILFFEEFYRYLVDNLFVFMNKERGFYGNFAWRFEQVTMLMDYGFIDFITKYLPNFLFSFLFFVFFFIPMIYFAIKKNKKMIFFSVFIILNLFFSIFSYSGLVLLQIYFLAPLFLIVFSKAISLFPKPLIIIFLISLSISSYFGYLHSFYNQYTGNEFGYKALCKYLNNKIQVHAELYPYIIADEYCEFKGQMDMIENCTADAKNGLNIFKVIYEKECYNKFIEANDLHPDLTIIKTSDGEELYYLFLIK